MPEPENNAYQMSGAIADFRRARQQAVMKEFMARLTGEATELLSYEEVRKTLKAKNTSDRGLHEIPLDAIVGSVNRYTDFTRQFLPKKSVAAERWARVELLTTGMMGLPPIEVYKIGEAYFVKDGNHRVSVARQMEATYIQAYVTEVQTRVPLTVDMSPEDLIIKAEYANFLERTELDVLRPQSDLNVSVPGQYPVLEEHIAVHRYYMGLERQHHVSEAEAVAHWYDTVYQPVAAFVQRSGILRDFPGRTVTDLYLWVAQHRADLEESLGREVRVEDAADDLAEQFGEQTERITTRLGGMLRSTLMPDTLEAGPAAGQWRREKVVPREDDRLFADILVPVNGQEEGWYALDQALTIARREHSRLVGLHIVPDEAKKESSQAQAVEADFNQRCAEAGIPGKLIVAAGDVTRRICEYSRYSDLVVVNLAYPPSPQPLAALGSGFKSLIQRCPRPVLATPGVNTPMERPMLAFDGSPKSKEALFIATYLAGQWKLPLVVATIFENGRVTPETIAEAWNYLEEHGLQATYVKAERKAQPVADQLLQIAEEQACDFLLMGGYVHSPILDVVLGNTVDQVLRESRKPLLICR